MKSRSRRIALLTMAAGCLVVAGLVAFNWATVRDHAEAWWLQATRDTGELRPLPGAQWCMPCRFQDLADQSDQPVILPSDLDMDGREVDDHDREPSALLALRKAGFRIPRASASRAGLTSSWAIPPCSKGPSATAESPVSPAVGARVDWLP